MCPKTTRRKFLKTSLMSGAAVMAAGSLPRFSRAAGPGANGFTSQVSLVHGDDRAGNIYQALMLFKDEIKAAIGGKRVVIKPNCVIHKDDAWRYEGRPADLALSDSSALQLEGILEFLQEIGKIPAIVMEACATGLTMEAYDNLGYLPLAGQYPVKFMDMNQERFEEVKIYRGGNRRIPIRVSSVFKDPGTFVISAAKFKTHNNAIATLALKNISMGAPIQDINGKDKDKGDMHGEGNQDLNDNLYTLAASGVACDLAVLDGYEGMEGDGPNHGDPVDQKVAVASLDWLAADRVGLELMDVPSTMTAFGDTNGFPVYYLYCAQAGLGEFDLSKIEVMGETVADHKAQYKVHDDIADMINMDPAPPDARAKRMKPAAVRPSAPPLGYDDEGNWIIE